MQSFDFKKLLPHLLIILGFIVLAALYSYPQLQGEVLNQHDIVSWKGMVKEGMDYHEKTGENVLWSNSMFGGMPTYTHYVPESNNYIYSIQTAITTVLGKPISFLFIAMFCFYILISTLGANKLIGIIGSIAYAFSSYNVIIIGAGHETKMLAIAYMPAVIAGLLLLYRVKWWRGVPILGISLALMISTGHYQIIYYTIFIILAALIDLFIKAIKNGALKKFFIRSSIAAIIALVALGPNMPSFLTTLEYNKTTMRGGNSELTINHDASKQQSKNGGLDKDYAFRWSNGKMETFCILVPGLYGGSSSEDAGENSATYDKLTSMGVGAQDAARVSSALPLYWGDQPFLSGPVYFGAIICLLFVLGLLVIKSPHKWWLVAASAFGIMMSWGKNFEMINFLLFDILPGLNKFRTPSMWLVIPQVLFPLLGMWGLYDIVQEKVSKEELWKKVKLSVIITGGLSLLLGVGGSMFLDFRSDNDAQILQQYTQSFGNNQQAAQQVMSAIYEDRADMAMNSSLVSALFILLAGGLLWAFAQKKIKGQQMLIGLAILVTIDLVKTDTRYLNESNYIEEDAYDAAFIPRPVDQQIKQDPDPYYRVLDLSRNTYNDAIQSYHHKTIGGYHPAKIEAYQDMIDIHLGGNGFNAEVLNMLNAKYIIFGGQGGQATASPNPGALGNAWFVNNIKWVETADEEILSLSAHRLGDTSTVPDAFNAATTAVIRKSFEKELGDGVIGKDSTASIKLTKYGLNDLSFESNNSQTGLAVFSDIYYPYGWKAYVDGQETPIVKANYILRAIKIPAGQHKIEFKFHPDSFYTGNTIALISSILLILMTIAAIVMMFRQGQAGTETKA
ncbi:MAG: YfhO family protein [Flavipsychrobacter sp.]